MTESIYENKELLEKSLREALQANKQETHICNDYKNDLEMAIRNLKAFQNHLRVDVMVPLGRHALMPGHLFHTNEVLIGKPSGIYIEATTSQALDIVQRRMKAADTRLTDLEVEREFFQNKLEYPQQKDVFSDANQKDIIEPYDEEAETKWRIEHRQKVKEAKMREREERNQQVPDEDFQNLLENLEELELMEELQDEFNSIVEPPPVDLSGAVEFKEKPRLSYALDTYTSTTTEDRTSTSAPVTKNSAINGKPIESNNEPIVVPQEKKRKSLQFSDNLERVKLIHKMDRPNTLITKYDPELTLQLKFRHSPVEYSPPQEKCGSELIQSPVDIYKHFAHCMKHWTAPSTPDDQPRSILKKHNHVIPVNRKAKLVSTDDNDKSELLDPSETVVSGNIYEQVVGDVLEKNVTPEPAVVVKKKKKSVGFGDSTAEDSKSPTEAVEEPKRVSRFKAMRS